jgi:hypothetical protein
MKHRAPTELDRTCRDSFYKHIAPTALVSQNALTPILPHSPTPTLPYSHTSSLLHRRRVCNGEQVREAANEDHAV